MRTAYINSLLFRMFLGISIVGVILLGTISIVLGIYAGPAASIIAAIGGAGLIALGSVAVFHVIRVLPNKGPK